MKTKLFSAGICLLFATFLMVGCQQDEIVSPTIGGSIINSRGDCTTDCIDLTAIPVTYFSETGEANGNIGNNWKKIEYEVYNTETSFIVKLRYTRQNGNNTPTVKVTVNSVMQTLVLPYNTWTTYTFALPAGWAACDVTSFSLLETVFDGQNPIAGAGTYDLIGVCDTGCDEESFSYTTDDNLNVVFTYNAASELTDAVVEFTFPQVLNSELNEDGLYVGADGKLYTVNNTENQTVFTWTGDIGCTASTAETFAFSFEPDCGAGNANDGKAVIWTDTKVNGLSVKGDNASIVYEGCN